MKEATGETSMTMITIAAIAVIAALLALLWDPMQKWIMREFDEIVDSGNDLDLGGQQKPSITPTQP